LSMVQFTSVPAGKLSVTLSPVAVVSLLLVRVTVKPICDPELTLAASAVLLIETSGGTVGVGVGVGVGVNVAVAVGVNVAVAVAVGVKVAVAVGVGLSSGVGVGVNVAVAVAVGVGVGVGQKPWNRKSMSLRPPVPVLPMNVLAPVTGSIV
jgi:hypothetical protein